MPGHTSGLTPVSFILIVLYDSPSLNDAISVYNGTVRKFDTAAQGIHV